jgi:hypothetical protein
LVGAALWFLPVASRNRYRWEWLAALEEMERENVAPLVPAIRILLGAPSVSRTLRISDQVPSSLIWLVLVVAAGVDIVTLQQALLPAINESEAMLWVMASGATVVAVTLAHMAGTQARLNTFRRDIDRARPVAWTLVGTWLLLGLVFFLLRLTVPFPAGSSTFVIDGAQPLSSTSATDDTPQSLAAMMLLALYLATGAISGLAGFMRQPPRPSETAVG